MTSLIIDDDLFEFHLSLDFSLKICQSTLDCEPEEMRRFILVIFSVVNFSYVITQRPTLIESEAFHGFPPDFSFGASTAAYQIEGGWEENGKGPSIWDTLVHDHPELVADRSTADVGPDSYHFYKSDLQALKQVGVNIIDVLGYQTLCLF